MTLKRNLEKNYCRTVHDTFDDVPVEKKTYKYSEETPKELLFTADSLFSKKFLKELSSILGSGEYDIDSYSEGRIFKKKNK